MNQFKLSINDESITAKPFLRWAGGKSWFLKEISNLLPLKFNKYFEPFLGSGAVFFHLRSCKMLSSSVLLSDLNYDLINCFREVRDNIENVINILSSYENNEQFYYKIRKETFHSECESAAKFIYLNRTSFNGIYRVNLRGIYNVPYGHKKYRVLFDWDNLRNCSQLLKGIQLNSSDFANCQEAIGKGDLVFLDPPYTVAHGENGFIKYNQKIFSWADQLRLSSVLEQIENIGAYYILTNAKHHTIKELFGKSKPPVCFSRASVIGGKKAKRGTIEEYVFTNSI